MYGAVLIDRRAVSPGRHVDRRRHARRAAPGHRRRAPDPDRPASTPVTTRTPAIARATPTTTPRGTGRPRSRSRTTVQIGVVVTSAVDAVTVVIRRLGIQSAKCTARATPAPTAVSSGLRSPRKQARATRPGRAARRTARWREPQKRCARRQLRAPGRRCATTSGAENEMPDDGQGDQQDGDSRPVASWIGREPARPGPARQSPGHCARFRRCARLDRVSDLTGCRGGWGDRCPGGRGRRQERPALGAPGGQTPRRPRPGRAWPAWHVWLDGAAYVVSGPGEQPLPPLDGEVELILRSKDTWARLVTVRATASTVSPARPRRGPRSRRP